MADLISHAITQTINQTGAAADGSGPKATTNDKKTVTTLLDEKLPSGKTCRATITLTVDDVADTQAGTAAFTFNPNTPLDEADLAAYDAFVTTVDGLIDTQKTNYPTT